MILTENVFRCKHFSGNWQQFSFSYKDREVNDQNASKTSKNDQITPKITIITKISLESQKICVYSVKKKKKKSVWVSFNFCLEMPL